MPKRKKHPRLPSGWGSIRYLGKGRTNPYAVHPPCTEQDKLGFYIRPAALCYVPDWYTGFAVLTAYHANTYRPGMELTIRQEVEQSNVNLDIFCQRVIKDISLSVESGKNKPQSPTFAEVYNRFIAYKYGDGAPKKLSRSSQNCMAAAWKRFKPVQDKEFDTLTLDELQEIINKNGRNGISHAALKQMITLLKQVYKYAIPRHLCNEDVARYIQLPAVEEDEHGVPLTDEDLTILWNHKSDPVVQGVLIMCYSGFRISAYREIEINTEKMYFKGGVKTRASKNRIVPIHPGIADIVINGEGIAVLKKRAFRDQMDRIFADLNLERHTPHDCRHTFSRLCEKYGVAENDRKRLMGHSFGADITNAVYGHRTLEDLRQEILKIKLPDNTNT